MIPESITIDGRSGTVVYLDDQWHPTSPAQAVMARVLFDDGGTAFYTTGQSLADKRDVSDEPRDVKGKWTTGGSTSGFDPKKKETWYRNGGDWRVSATGEIPYEDEIFRQQRDPNYVPPPVTHKVIRGGNIAIWGYSHGGSQGITGEAAKQMGIGDEWREWRDFDVSDAEKSVAARMLKEIAHDEMGSEEPLYHVFENVEGTTFRPGDTMKLPLTATAGDPGTMYGMRLEHENQQGPPTVFVFPKGTKMMGYSKPMKKDLEDEGVDTLEEAYKQHGHIWDEAIVAGQFQVEKVETKYMGSQHSLNNDPGPVPQLYGQVVQLKPIGYFNPEKKKWEAHG